MFGRQVTLKLKPDAAAELTRIVRSEIIPILRRQRGFRDDIPTIRTFDLVTSTVDPTFVGKLA